MADIIAARDALSDVLGKNGPEYWALLRSWFRCQISKEELDTGVRALLQGNLSLHTTFMLSILLHCQPLSTPVSQPRSHHQLQPDSKSAKSSGAKSNDAGAVADCKTAESRPEHTAAPAAVATTGTAGRQRPERRLTPWKRCPRIEPYPLLKFNNKLNFQDRRVMEAHVASWRPSTQSFLPDLPGLRSRMQALAWSANLEIVQDDVVHLMYNAVENHVRKLLVACSRQAGGSDVVGELRHSRHHTQYTPVASPARSGFQSILALIDKEHEEATSTDPPSTGGSSSYLIGGQSSVCRITSLHLYRAATDNLSLFGGRSLAVPFIHKLETMI